MDVMQFLEPITYDNIRELEPGEWIWDNIKISKSVHKRDLSDATIYEEYGFRQIDILDLKDFGRFSNTPFMLTSAISGRAKWEYFEPGRFYRFKRQEETE